MAAWNCRVTRCHISVIDQPATPLVRSVIVFFQHFADADVLELARLARTIDRWRPASARN
jgi:hypothetical protein